MNNRGGTIAYKKWRNPEISMVTCRSDGDRLRHTDEDQCEDNELCTTGFQHVDQDVNTAAPDGPGLPTERIFTVDEAVESIGFGRFQKKLSMLIGLGWMVDGMEMMVLIILVPQMYCDWRLPSNEVAVLTSIALICAMVTSSMLGHDADKNGRKLGLIMYMVWTLYFGLTSAFASFYIWALVLRGRESASVTLYTEFLPTKSRATCIILIKMFWALGTVFEVLLFMLIMPIYGFRWLLALTALPMLVILALCFWLPESVRFDVLSGNREKALATLRRIAADNGKPMPSGILVADEQIYRGRMKDLFTPGYWRTTLLLWFIWFTNAFSYYGLVLLTTELFQAGETCAITQGAKFVPVCDLQCNTLTLDGFKDLLCTTLAEFPGLLVTLFMIKRIGRKECMAVCFLIFSLCILPLYASIGRTALTIFIFIARAFISGGFQVAYVYTTEVYPTAIRALGLGTSSGMARVGALLTPCVAQVLLKTSVSLTLSVYCVCCLLAAGASLALPIETTGRGLQESSYCRTGEDQSPEPSLHAYTPTPTMGPECRRQSRTDRLIENCQEEQD